MKTVGVTGGVGCGKSEILRRLSEECACEVIRTDEVANGLKEPGGACYDEMVALLGEDVLRDSRIDRVKMAEKIFSDKALLRQVNEVLHPAVRRYVEDAISRMRTRKEIAVLFVEAALLLECGYASEKKKDAVAKAGIAVNPAYGITLDEIWYVYAPEEVRRERLKKYRAYTDEKIDGIMKKQLTSEQFRAGCDFEINNGGAIEDAVAAAKNRIREIT